MAGRAAEIDSPPPRLFSVLVLDVPVFGHRLMVMAALTQRLPVRFVPEQVRVATMRLDMIHDRCRDEPSFLFASDTPWMTFQKELPGLLPLSSVATCFCINPVAWHCRLCSSQYFFHTALALGILDTCTVSAVFLAFVSSPASKRTDGVQASALHSFLADYSISYRSQ